MRKTKFVRVKVEMVLVLGKEVDCLPAALGNIAWVSAIILGGKKHLLAAGVEEVAHGARRSIALYFPKKKSGA